MVVISLLLFLIPAGFSLKVKEEYSLKKFNETIEFLFKKAEIL